MKKRVLLGMSGGVDSAVAALLLMRDGYEVIGATLQLQDPSDTALRELADAQATAAKLGIWHLTPDWREPFRQLVQKPFAESYQAGETPNPCVLCNRVVKFAALFETAGQENISYVATGHYARIEHSQNGETRLLRGLDPQKDQSYMLYALPQNWLQRILFPLGSYTKQQTRALAGESELPIATKSDSQDICFIPDGDYAAFLERYFGCPCPSGEFVDGAGNLLGVHRGIWHYTVGQRKGLGISLGYPAFVQTIDAANNRITLSENDALFSHSLLARDLHWTGSFSPQSGSRVTAKIRYGHSGAPATLTLPEDGLAALLFDQPQRAAAPGQAVVFYDGDYVLGGGTILSPTARKK